MPRDFRRDGFAERDFRTAGWGFKATQVNPQPLNHTVTTLRDCFTGIRSLFREKLTDRVAEDDVRLAFMDERASEADHFPVVTLSLYEVRYDVTRRYGGRIRQVITDRAAGTASVKKPPVPVELYFQLDTYCDKMADDWILMETLLRLLGRRVRVMTPDGVAIDLGADLLSMAEAPADNLWRKTIRMRASIWFEDAGQAEQKYLILHARLTLNGERWSLESCAA